ncbi:cytokine receptor common subunit beta isoform X8 [Tachysurus fulvidraco]|uniref:cytokine receptor common subunit beta isoform X8 n=1 Tax=Tachysurus fulvidraco TaxID=1234273 RepID=UPI000F4ECE74|nr:cytokine receptor common subunit beta isoform X8 [Tachysurus fulvidraco]XP_027024285.1 cytokine receptor common subunit beta isoform X8 [Tachysurus fulvidraco]
MRHKTTLSMSSSLDPPEVMKTHILSPASAVFLWVWCSSFPPTHGTTACPNLGPSAAESPALDSLECRNDYMTHIRCSWTGVADLPLLHLDPDERRASACVPGTLTAQNASGLQRSQCRYNTSLFAIGFDDVFFFFTPHARVLSGTTKLTQYGNITADWNVQLVSETSSPEVAQSVTFNLRASHMRILGELREEDRMSLTMKQNKRTEGLNVTSFSGSLPGPFNLQCVYDTEHEVKCKWQMKRELVQYVVYNLSYRTHLNATSELCCTEFDADDDDDAIVNFSCSFSVPDAETLLLSLHSHPRTKVFQSHKNIEPAAPVDMRVELIGDDWVLNWTLPKYRTVPISSEFRYWSSTSPESAETLSLPTGVSVCVMAESLLRSSTTYLAQVRCSVSPRRVRETRYAGYPSDWTKPVYWTTRSAPVSAPVWMYFLLSVSVTAALILMYFISHAFRRFVLKSCSVTQRRMICV